MTHGVKSGSSGKAWVFALALILLGPPTQLCADGPLTRFEASQIHMGTEFAIVLYAPDQAQADKGFGAAFARIRALDEKLSDYQAESELSLLSRAAPTKEPVRLSPDLFRVLAEAQKFSAATDGAFDLTVGPLTKLWRRSKRQKELPEARALAAAREAVGYKNLLLEEKEHTAELRRPNMRLDLGGIGQGFAADEALAKLRQLELPIALINASGDIMAGDPPPGEPGWKIGIAPLKANDPPSRFVRVKNCAVSTSGDAFQFVEIDGRRYSHIVDPRTGLGLPTRASVTVIAPNCTTADALATGICVLGPEQGLKVAAKFPEVECLFVLADGEVKTTVSPGFERFQTKE